MAGCGGCKKTTAVLGFADHIIWFSSCTATFSLPAIAGGSVPVECTYLPSFQISVASFQALPTFSHTTTYLPVISSRSGTLSFETEGPDLARCRGPQRLDVDYREFRIA